MQTAAGPISLESVAKLSSGTLTLPLSANFIKAAAQIFRVGGAEKIMISNTSIEKDLENATEFDAPPVQSSIDDEWGPYASTPDDTERFLAALDPEALEFTFQTFDDNKERSTAFKKANDG